MDPWPHQTRLTEMVLDAIAQGERRICLQLATGGGKTFIIQMLAKHFLDQGKKVAVYTNRQMLVKQLSDAMTEAGLYHGVRADGYDDEREHNFQISSIQTEHSRVTKRKTWNLHEAELVIVDEAHIQTGQTAQTLLCAHHDQGAAYVGTTATPLGIGEIYTELIGGVTMKELRDCGALVPAIHYGADEPDLKAFVRAKKKVKAAEGENLSERQQGEVMMTPTIFGRVWEWYDKLNPERKPTLLFGPSVEGSIWFAEQFTKKGLSAAHIDGNDIWFGGKWYRSDPKAREDMRNAHRDGKLKVVTNRYVLREGVDWPWINHIILAFVAGSLQTYLQTCGRGLRSYPGKDCCVIQGHGGEWWRHGSVNHDREWALDLSDSVAYGLRRERLTKNRDEIPFRCPKCGRVWSMGRECRIQWGGCGFVLEPGLKQSRPVVGTAGQLRELTTELFAPRRITKDSRGPSDWERMYWRSRTEKGKRTFNAAIALFAQEHNFGYPDRDWPYMPIRDIDLFRLVIDVPMDRLVQKEVVVAQ